MGKTNSGKSTKEGADAHITGAGFQVSREPVVHGKTEQDVHKYEVTREPAPVPEFEDLGQLPESYGEQTLYLIARDPRWLFSYWEVDWAKYPASKMQNGERKIFLKVSTASGAEESNVEINPEAKNWYVPVNHPATTYFAEIGYFDKEGEWNSIVRSGPATTPPDALSEEAQVNFATVPFHLTFQRLLEMVKTTMTEGETLINALSRLQGEGRKLAFAAGSIPEWSEDQKRILAALFGDELVNRIGMGSGEIDQLLRKQLQEKLSTESASEIMAKGQLAALLGPGAESSLFSAMGLWGPEVTSLFSGIGASWSAQPFSVERPREFFMHVNAEVIFYGGTHPDAKVTIDGKEIALNPDGTFRYHFRFPDGNYEIPVVAQSPDKVEERSATLAFKRATGRRGDVGHSAQPEKLKRPLGKK